MLQAPVHEMGSLYIFAHSWIEECPTSYAKNHLEMCGEHALRMDKTPMIMRCKKRSEHPDLNDAAQN